MNDLLAAPRHHLAHLLATGHPIDAARLDDTEYIGTSLGLPSFVERLTWKTFRKVFHRDPQTGHLRGWNVRVRQDAPPDEAPPQLVGTEPRTFGHYRVVSPSACGAPPRWARGLMIHYGLGGNGRLDATQFLRDPIVALEAGSVDTLLGFSYVQLGPLDLPTPSYFLLKRAGPLTHVHAPPRRPDDGPEPG